MAHPRSTIFHHSAWIRVLRDRYGHQPVCYVLKNEHGEIVGAAPFLLISSRLVGRRISCLPSTEYCFPLAHNGESIERLLSPAKRVVDSGRASYLEIKGWGSPISPQEFGLEEKPNYFRHVTTLDSDSQRLKSKLTSENYHLKRNLTRAETSEMNICEAKNEDDVRQFYLMNTISRRRLNLLPWPYDFYHSIYKHMVESGHGFMLLVKWQDKLVAGGLFFRFKDTIMNKINWFDKEYSQLRPSYFLTWKAMERACQEGYKFYDLGLSDTDNPGLIAYKRQWSSQETVLPLYYYYSSKRRFFMPLRTSLRYRHAYYVINRLLPSWLANLAGRFLYRHLG